MKDKRQVLYEFSGFRLDPGQRILMRNGELVALTPKGFDTLLFLVQNSGRVLGKDELMKALWPESFVEESNLSQNIFLLRKLLGDDRNGNRFIQTIPRRGYRFVAAVITTEATEPTPGLPGADYWNQHSPFRGLQAFQAEDAWLFFGREAETEDLLARLDRSPVVALVGNSGSGKSSLVRAGLIPALRAGAFCHQGSWITSWRIAVFRPSAAPFDYLAEVLPHQLAPELNLREQAEFIADCRSKLSASEESLRNAISALANAADAKNGLTHILLVVDQFEELFTLTMSHEIRKRYIDALLAASRWDASVPVHLVLALRADFYAQCLDHAELSRCLEVNLCNVPRMSAGKLRESIEKRLRLAGAAAEAGLIDSLLEDAGSEPGNLALLEHALGQLWEKCGGFGCTLTNTAYSAIGRLRGALSRHADEVYSSLGDEKQKRLAQRIFWELVHLGEGAQDTRRRVRKEDLVSLGAPEQVETVLTRLTSSRLISTGREGQETFVEVSHEALIREWPTLREWLAQNREELRLERRLHRAAEEWEALNRDPGSSLQGARLAQGQEWLAKHPNASPLVREFLKASIEIRAEARERELAQQTELRNQAEARATAEKQLREQQAASALLAGRSASRLRRLSSALGLLLLVALGAVVVAYKQKVIERSHALAAQSANLITRDHGQALALAIQSWRTAKTDEAHVAVAKAFPELLVILNHGGAVVRAMFSPDGKRILSAGGNHGARLWDTASDRLLSTVQPSTGEVEDAAFSPDAERMVTVSSDQMAYVWKTADGSLLATLGVGKPPAVRFDASVAGRVVFSPDGARIVTTGWDNTARVWNTDDGRLLAVLEGHSGIIVDVAFSPNGKHIVTASWDHTARIWSGEGKPESTLAGHTGLVAHAEFSPDGQQILTTSWDRTARIWESRDGGLLAILPHDGYVSNGGFAPNGERIVRPLRSRLDDQSLAFLSHDSIFSR